MSFNLFIFNLFNTLPRYLEDLYTLTYQEDSLDKDEDEDPEIPAWGASRFATVIQWKGK